MPNWCITNHTIVGEEKELSELYNLMKKLEDMKTPLVENGFGSDWLGCLVVALGKKWQEYRCRGCWTCLEKHEGSITFDTTTAWCPMNEVFDLLCEKFPSISHYYYAEEPGCCIYETNDIDGEYYPDRFYVDICTSDECSHSEYFEEIEDALNWISKMEEYKFNTRKEVEEYFKERSKENDNVYCYIHDIELSDD